MTNTTRGGRVLSALSTSAEKTSPSIAEATASAATVTIISSHAASREQGAARGEAGQQPDAGEHHGLHRRDR